MTLRRDQRSGGELPRWASRAIRGDRDRSAFFEFPHHLDQRPRTAARARPANHAESQANQEAGDNFAVPVFTHENAHRELAHGEREWQQLAVP